MKYPILDQNLFLVSKDIVLYVYKVQALKYKIRKSSGEEI